MSFDLPASVGRDLEQYAQAEHISPAEAAVKFIQSGLKSSKRKAASRQRFREKRVRWLTKQAQRFGLSVVEAPAPEVAA